MKLIRQSKLELQEGNSDKVYEVDLCKAGEGDFLVNFRYGRRGSNLRDGTKTVFPVSLTQAESIFDKLVSEKTRKGYRVSEESGLATTPPEAESSPTQVFDDPRRVVVQQRLAAAAKNRKSIPESWRLSRILWRAGLWQMRETADSIVALIPQLEKEMECWSAAWALGRCGSAEHAPALDALRSRSSEFQNLDTILPEVMMALDQAYEETVELPSRVKQDWEQAQEDNEHSHDIRTRFKEDCEKSLRNKEFSEAQQRELIFRSRQRPWLRELVHSLLKVLPIQEGTAAFFRQALKSAEFRLDAELYGQVMRRFETSRGAPAPYYYNPRQKPPAASSTTLRYFRRRAMNHLRWLGESKDPALYISLATGVLAAFDDDMAEAIPEPIYSYQWDPSTRRGRTIVVDRPHFARCLSFLWILRSGNPNLQLSATRSVWQFIENHTGPPTTREEAFPELWNQAPDAIIYLLRVSRATLVQEFALRIWKENPDFKKEADNGVVADLLNSWFQPTRELALALAKERWNPKEPEEGLLLAMLSSELDEARQLGSEWLKELDSQWLDSASLLSAIAFLPHEEGRLAARDAIRGIALSPETKQDITSNIVSGLLALDAEDPLAGPAVDWLWQIVPNEISRLPDEHLLSLARHESEAAQLLSVRILLSREDLSTINEELLLSAVLSEHASVRKQGMSVLGKLNDTQLAQRTETLAACAVSNHLELREAATPLLARVTKSDPEAARQLAAKWYHLLFREEHFEGLHASLYETLTTAFAEQLDVIPKGQYHQMLDSSHAHGQMLGFFIMKQSGDTPSSDNLINWSNHALISVREWARSQFETSQLRQDPKAAIVLLESPYSDTRDWAFQICREEVQDGDWTPENLVAICDSCIEEVSAFGREQVTRLFSEEDGALYLAHLSQHPSTEMQIFATNYLERFASGHPERISDLDLYFRTILSRIGAGRIAKHRVLTFLEKEALADEATAQQVASLLARQSGTVAIQDKAEMIRILYLIQNRWPKVENPLQPKTLPVFQAS